MQSFAEELIAARKAQGMTQVQLAEAVNVSRSTVSHWETGRAEPDDENIRLLSKVLDHDFAQSNTPDIENTQEQIVDSPTPSSWRWWGYVYTFMGGISAALLIWFVLISPASPDALSAADKVHARVLDTEFSSSTRSIPWFKLPNQPVAGQAFLQFDIAENPARAIRTNDLPGGIGWKYALGLREAHGYDFVMEECYIVVFLDETRADIYLHRSDSIIGRWGNNTVPAGGRRRITGGLPMDSSIGVGFLIKGTDILGNELTFRYYLELSQEVAESAALKI